MKFHNNLGSFINDRQESEKEPECGGRHEDITNNTAGKYYWVVLQVDYLITSNSVLPFMNSS